MKNEQKELAKEYVHIFLASLENESPSDSKKRLEEIREELNKNHDEIIIEALGTTLK